MSVYEKTIEYASSDNALPREEIDREEYGLIVRCQNGDSTAFNALFKRYRNQVYRMAYRYSRNQADAEDILQNAFIRAFKYIHRFDTRYPFYPWLRTIVTNESQTYLGNRKKKQHEPLEVNYPEEKNLLNIIPDERVEPADKKIERNQLGEEIHSAISQLPNQQRICFTLFEIEMMKVREIAVMLGCTEGTVKTHLHRARYSLRNILKDKINLL